MIFAAAKIKKPTAWAVGHAKMFFSATDCHGNFRHRLSSFAPHSFEWFAFSSNLLCFKELLPLLYI